LLVQFGIQLKARLFGPDSFHEAFSVGFLQKSLPLALERGEKEPGAAVLLAIIQEFGKSVDWLLTEVAPKDHCNLLLR